MPPDILLKAPPAPSFDTAALSFDNGEGGGTCFHICSRFLRRVFCENQRFRVLKKGVSLLFLEFYKGPSPNGGAKWWGHAGISTVRLPDTAPVGRVCLARPAPHLPKRSPACWLAGGGSCCTRCGAGRANWPCRFFWLMVTHRRACPLPRIPMTIMEPSDARRA